MGSSESGFLQTYLFPGAVYNSYEMSIYAQVYDSGGAYTVYEFPQPIMVNPDLLSNLTTVEKYLISKDPTFSLNIALNQGSLLEIIQIIQKISGLLNDQSLSDELGLIKFSNNTELKFPQIYGPLVDFNKVLAVGYYFFQKLL